MKRLDVNETKKLYYWSLFNNHCYFLFSARQSTECSVNYCDHSPSVGVRPSVHNFLFNSLPSANIYQSAPNLVKIYDHKISDEFYYGVNQIRTVRVVCPWIRKFAIFDVVYTLASANIDQSVPNLATTYMSIRPRISSEHLELFALEFE